MDVSLKTVVVGDGSVGKSCLLITYTTNSFPSDYCPTVFDNYNANVIFEGQTFSLGLWDTAGQEDYDRLRPLSYPDTNVFLCCFSVVSQASYDNVLSKWVPELRQHCPDVPIVILGTKTDLRSDTSGRFTTKLTKQDGEKLAAQVGAYAYVETSSVNCTGLQEAFNTAIKAAVTGGSKKSKSSKKKAGGWGGSSSSSSSSKPEPVAPTPPALPKAEKTPYVNIDTSVYADCLHKMFTNPTGADVDFIVTDTLELSGSPVKKTIAAHKIILASASTLMRRIFGFQDDRCTNSSDNEGISFESINEGGVVGFTQIRFNTETNRTELVVSNTIEYNVFKRIVEFWYYGTTTIQHKKDFTAETLTAAKIFQVELLDSYVQNVMDDFQELNPSIGTFLNDKTAYTLKHLFFDKPNPSESLADIKVSLAGGSRIVHVHSSILSSQCEVMAKMLSSGMAEAEQGCIEVDPEIPEDVYLSFLEYIYTSHCPLDSGEQALGVLMLANQYGLPRLTTLCELYISKQIEKVTAVGIEKAEINVVDILLVAQAHQAAQLEKWCLHFLSVNYQPMSKREEFKQLEGANKKHVEENQWPPKSYFKQVEAYEAAMKKYTAAKNGSEKTECLVM